MRYDTEQLVSAAPPPPWPVYGPAPMKIEPREHRIRRVLDALARAGATSRSALARALGIDARTLLTDLHFAEGLGIARRVGVGRDAKWTVDPAERRGLLDRIALRLGRGVLVFLDGTSVAEVFERLSDDTESNAKNLDRKFVHHQEPARRYADKADVLDRIIDGLVKERALAIEYREGPAQNVRPLTLVVYRRAVYLLALDERENVERYAVERMRSAALGAPFTYPPDWDPEAELGPYFGIYKRGAAERVVLRFTAAKAELCDPATGTAPRRSAICRTGGSRS